MYIKDMFVKEIDRDIKGVIKVGQDDGENIYQELDEYVVTREMRKHFREFFESYKRGINGNTDKMGVWISGFFGSGKSHFLKILSYLLQNREVNGKHAIEFFIDGDKLNDSMIIADITAAGNTSADVILFNIDSKSEAGSKSNKDAILDVFVKVFNEMQGFCGSIPFIAELERNLSENNQYDKFKEAFKKIAGREWEQTREEFYFIQDEIVQALISQGVMTEEAARNWCEKASETYTMSIERFADMVRKYCEKKANNHHVIFLVDEIGQYLADNTNLMLNLQTLTEDLGTYCGGKAWIVVTSQQDIDSVVKVKGNDFSKIQGRFDTRLSLSSANVDEVIRKRILDKKDIAKETLGLLYDQQESIIKNLITFTDDSDKKLYKDREDFAAVYPFIPYQFNLLGQVLTAIRIHSSSGKHLAEGERSMIALFKESAMTYKDAEEGIIIPFNVFYNALDKFIDHTHRIVIKQAEENTRLEAFDVELLKTLFMIKHVKEIRATVEDLATLMVSSIHDDRLTLRKQIEDSLGRLEKQTLIQKNGGIYTFLTNEEQDINKAIQNETVEMGEIINKVMEIIFQDLIHDTKFKYSARYNFSYNQNVDGRFHKNNQSADIGVKIITPYYDEDLPEEKFRMLSLSENYVYIHLPNDTAFLDEIVESLKIYKYLMKHGVALAKTHDAIKRAKEEERIEKNKRAKLFIEESLKYAEIYVSGNKVNIGTKEPVSRINEALQKLVNTKYHKLNYMETAPSQIDIERVFSSNDQLIMGGIDQKQANRLALEDVVNAIEVLAAKHVKATMKSLTDKFSSAPYGFAEMDIQWLVATLFKQGKVSFTINSKNISPIDTDAQELYKYISKRDYIEKLLIEKRERATEKQIKSVKEVMKDLFSMTCVSEEDDELMKSFKLRTADRAKRAEELLVEYRIELRFPGKKILETAAKLYADILDITNPLEFFRYVDEHRDDLLDLAEEIAPVNAFFEGEQKKIFKKALKNVDIFDESKTYVTDKAIIALVENIRKIVSKSEPYGEIYKLPDLLDQFISLHIQILDNEAKPIIDTIEHDQEQVLKEIRQKGYETIFESKFIEIFASLRQKLDTANSIAAVKNIGHESDVLKIRCIDEVAEYDKSRQTQYPEGNEPLDGTGGDGDMIKDPPVHHAKKHKNITMKSIGAGSTITIEKEEDIDRFLKEVKNRIMKELSEEADTVIKLFM